MMEPSEHPRQAIEAIDNGRFKSLVEQVYVDEKCFKCSLFNFNCNHDPSLQKNPEKSNGFRCGDMKKCIGFLLSERVKAYMLYRLGLCSLDECKREIGHRANTAQLMQSLTRFVKILREEYREVAVLAHDAGWRSKRQKEGEAVRALIHEQCVEAYGFDDDWIDSVNQEKIWNVQ